MQRRRHIVMPKGRAAQHAAARPDRRQQPRWLVRNQNKRCVFWWFLKFLEDRVGNGAVHLVGAINDDHAPPALGRAHVQERLERIGAIVVPAQGRHCDILLQRGFGLVHHAAQDVKARMRARLHKACVSTIRRNGQRCGRWRLAKQACIGGWFCQQEGRDFPRQRCLANPFGAGDQPARMHTACAVGFEKCALGARLAKQGPGFAWMRCTRDLVGVRVVGQDAHGARIATWAAISLAIWAGSRPPSTTTQRSGKLCASDRKPWRKVS